MKPHSKPIVLVLLSTVVTSIGNGLLKLGAQTVSLKNPLNPTLLLGVVFYALSAAMFILALRTGELSVLYPLYGLNFVWINLIAFRFFGEPMPLLKWVGIAVIISGLVMIGRSSKQPPGEVVY